MDVAPDFERAGIVVEQQPHEAEDIADPALREVDDAAVDHDVGVRAVEAEQVGKARDRDAEIRPGVTCPLLVQIESVTTRDPHRRQEVRGLITGAVDDDVDIVLMAVRHQDSRRVDLAERIGDQLHVVALERACPDAVVAHDPLRADRIVGRHLFEQVGPVAELIVVVLEQHLAGEVVDRAHGTTVGLPLRIDTHTVDCRVAHAPEDRESVEFAIGRQMPEQPRQAGADGVVIVRRRREPRRCALEHEDLPGHPCNFGHELHCAAAGADDGHSLADEVDVVTPFGGVEVLACERRDPLDLRPGRTVELTDRTDHGARRHALLGTVLGAVRHRPRRGVVAPRR